MEDMTGLDLALLIPPFWSPGPPQRLQPGAIDHYHSPVSTERPTGKYPGEWECRFGDGIVCVGWIRSGGFGVILGNGRTRPSLLSGSRTESKPTERDVSVVVHGVGSAGKLLVCVWSRWGIVWVQLMAMLCSEKAHLVNGAHLKTIMAG